MQRSFPIGVAQRKVVEALGVADKVTTYDEAEAFFARIGISVTPVRVGRTSEPSVRFLDSYQGGFTPDGDGDVWQVHFEKTDLTPIKQWVRR